MDELEEQLYREVAAALHDVNAAREGRHGYRGTDGEEREELERAWDDADERYRAAREDLRRHQHSLIS